MDDVVIFTLWLRFVTGAHVETGILLGDQDLLKCIYSYNK